MDLICETIYIVNWFELADIIEIDHFDLAHFCFVRQYKELITIRWSRFIDNFELKRSPWNRFDRNEVKRNFSTI